MAVTAADVKRLREETGAPMMDCKKALDEANGDFEKAKQILREKGKAAAGKKAGRATSEGLAYADVSEDGTKAAGIVVECETDFVARNEDFQAMVKSILADLMTLDAPAGEAKELSVDDEVGGKTLKAHMEEAVAKIRENIQLGRAVVTGAHDGAKFAAYNHHTAKSAALVEYTGDAANAADTAFQVAVQAVAFPPGFMTRDEVPKDVIDKEIATETARAVNEGKPEEVAAKIAQGRVNKEYYQQQVLLEQPFYQEAKSKVADWVASQAKEGGGSTEIKSFVYLAVGANEGDEG